MDLFHRKIHKHPEVCLPFVDLRTPLTLSWSSEFREDGKFEKVSEGWGTGTNKEPGSC